MRKFTSDLHLGHRNIIDFCDRPFRDVDHMDTELVRLWNEVVDDADEVWVLGDLLMGEFEHSLEVASRLRGHKILVPGNHDRCWRGGRKGWQDSIVYYEAAGFEIAHTDVLLELGAEEVYLCHFPPAGDSRDRSVDKFSAWRPEGWPGPILHGHVHDAWRQRGNWINVGVDVWDYAPVSEDTLVSLIRLGE